jgi:hypothetical protein
MFIFAAFRFRTNRPRLGLDSGRPYESPDPDPAREPARPRGLLRDGVPAGSQIWNLVNGQKYT